MFDDFIGRENCMTKSSRFVNTDEQLFLGRQKIIHLRSKKINLVHILLVFTVQYITITRHFSILLSMIWTLYVLATFFRDTYSRNCELMPIPCVTE